MAGRTNSRVTIKAVAEDAQVSVAAVSRVMRNAYGVSETLRARVLASVEKLNYRPHAGARSLRGQTYTVGVLFPDMRNPFFADLLSGMNDALERTQFSAMQSIGDHSVAREKMLIDTMIDQSMDGLILIAPRLTADYLRDIGERIPTVLVGLHVPGETPFDTVNNDDEAGARLVVRHLHDAGYKRVAFFSLDLEGFPSAATTVAHRRVGYEDAMQQLGRGRQLQVIEAPESSRREVQTTVRHLLASRQRPDAIFCWTDWIALEVLSVALEMNIHVPTELGVVGYDNTSYCDLAQNSLTSIDQSGQVIGLQAARLLIERISGRDRAEHFVVPPRLVPRGSTRRALAPEPDAG